MKKIFSILLCLLLSCPNVWATNGYVQSGQSVNATLTMGSTPVIGNTLICAVTLTTNATTIGSFTLGDNQASGGNTYTSVVTANVNSGFGDGRGNLIILYSHITKSSGTFTLTVTYTPGSGSTDSDYGVGCVEYAGLLQAPNLNVTNTGTGTSTTASPGAIAPSQANTLYFSVTSIPNAPGTTTALNTFTQRLTANPNWITTSDLIATGSETGSFTITNQVWLSAVAAFGTPLRGFNFGF